MEELRELRRFVTVARSQAKSVRNQTRTLTQMLAELEERLDAFEERLTVLEIAQPQEAQRNGQRSHQAAAAAR